MVAKDTLKPNHYGRWTIEPIEFIRANNLDFARANIIKYIMRFDAKDGVRDLDKAQQYLTWLREDWLRGQNLDSVQAQMTFDDESWMIAERNLYGQK